MNQRMSQIAIAVTVLVGALVVLGWQFDIQLLTSGQFIPHGHCYLWRRELVGLHLASDSLIALAYYSIPLTLIHFVRKRQDIPYPWMFLLFSAFIIACGTTHVIDVWTLWHPTYWLSALIKAVTATISLCTAVLLVPLVPRALALPSPAQLELANQALQREISDRKQTELSLSRLAAIVESSGDAIIGKSLEGTITSWNAGAEKLFGYAAEEVVGHPITILFPPDQVDELSQILKQVKHGETIERYETVRVRKDGQRIDIAATISPVKDATGKIIGSAKIARDMTERKQAEQALRESENRFQAFMNYSPLAAWITNADGLMLYANPLYRHTLHQFEEEIVGKTIAELYPVEIATHFLETTQQVIATNQVFEELDVVPSPNGTVNQFLVYKFPIMGSTGQTLVGGVAIDISELKQAEVTIQQSEARYRGIVEDQTELICRYSPDTTFLFVNEAYCRYFEVERDAILGRSYAPVIFEEDREHVAQLVNSMSLENPVVTIENRVVVNGQVRWTQWINRMIVNEQGDLIEYQAVGRDIHDLKQIEAALRQSEAKNRAMLAAVPDLLLRVRRDGTCLDFIPPTAPEAGTFVSIEQHISEILPTDLLQDQMQRMEQALATGKLQVWEHQFLKEGKLCDEEIRLISCGADEVLIIVRDVSDRKRTEHELQLAKEAAEAANVSKSTFLATMSHELRTPLNAILGFAQLISRDISLSQQHREQLGIILRSGEHLLRLINDILDMSKIDVGQMQLDETGFNLHQLLSSLIELMRLRTESKGLQLCLDCVANIPQFVQADENKLRQILLNLLSNAIKFTEKGSVTLRVRMGNGEWGMGNKEDTETQGIQNSKYPSGRAKPYKIQNSLHPTPHSLLCEIEDTGPGIAPDEIDQLFQPFVQTQTGRKSLQGTGLGLVISRRFVQLMGGDITVSSVLGQGTIFRFEIQVQPVSSEAIQVQSQVQPVISLAPQQTSRRILIAEDVAENRKLVVDLLSQVGFQVREATNGQEALDLWEQWSPELILMDMQMPMMDGYQAARQIRFREQGSTQPPTVIIALTASAFAEERSQMLSAGCNDCIFKPFKVDELLAAIATYLNVKYLYAAQPDDLKQTAEHPHSSSYPSAASGAYILHPASLDIMPTEWRSQFHQAICRLNPNQCLQLIQQVPSTHPDLSRALTDLVNHFEFEILLKLMEDMDNG